jgi:integrase
MATIRLPRGRTIYLARFYDRQGNRHEVSTETSDPRKAQKIADAMETDKGRGLPVGNGIGKIDFGTISTPDRPASGAVAIFEADYRNNERRSLADQVRRIRLHLEPAFGDRLMADITATEIAAYVDARRAAGAKPGTVNRELNVLSHMFTLCVQQQQLLFKPHIPHLRERNARAGFFERAAFFAVLRHMTDDALRDVLTFAYITGWRIDSEVLTREWRHVDWDTNVIRLDPNETKNGEAREFPLFPDLRTLVLKRRALADRIEANGFLCKWIFFRTVNTVRRRGKKHAYPPQRPKPIKDFKDQFDTARKAAGQPGRIPHDLRRTAVRNLIRQFHITERVAMQLCGHLTRTVFDRYNIVSDTDLREAAAKMTGAFDWATTGGGTGGANGDSYDSTTHEPQNIRKFGRS